MSNIENEIGTFVTMFFECRNFELVKDVAQIPSFLSKEHGVKTVLVSSRIDINGVNMDNVDGLLIDIFPMYFNNSKITGFIYLLKNAKKVTWLNIYHCDRKSLYWSRFYKLLNPLGKVYLKLDADFRLCNLFDADKKRRRVLTACTKIANLVSAESVAVKNRLQPYAKKKIAVIPDGYFDVKSNDLKIKRENVFLTVGRLGTKQKATEVLLEAFAKSAQYHDWNLRLVGSTEDSFKIYINQFYNKFPDINNRVSFVGMITDREILNQEYKRAKVFILPSRWESFGLVLAEAMSKGCRVIATDVVPPIMELTDNGKYGTIIPPDNVEILTSAIIEETKKDVNDEQAMKIESYIQENFSWSNICNRIYELLLES
jgi:Glycosyltransferase